MVQFKNKMWSTHHILTQEKAAELGKTVMGVREMKSALYKKTTVIENQM